MRFTVVHLLGWMLALAVVLTVAAYDAVTLYAILISTAIHLAGQGLAYLSGRKPLYGLNEILLINVIFVSLVGLGFIIYG